MRKKKALLKSTVASTLHYFYQYDKEWITNNLSIIFDNHYDGRNLSFVGFQASQIIDVGFLEKFNLEGFLSALLNSKEFDNFSANYSSHILYLYLEQKLDDTVLLSCTLGKKALVGFGYLVDFLAKSNDYLINQDRLDKILIFFENNITIYESNYSWLGLKVIELYNKISNRTQLLKLCVILFSFKNSVFSIKKIVNTFAKSNVSAYDKKKIVWEYVHHLDEHYYNVDEVCELIGSIDFSYEEFVELMNYLGEKNPEYLIKIKEIIKGKYKK